MDSSLNIKSSSTPARSRALRDPVPVRETADTDLIGDRAVAAVGDGGGKERDTKDGTGSDNRDHSRPADRAPQDLVANPDSRDVLYRERDVRASEREHPDQALLRQRAYHQLTPAASDAPPSNDPHADIKA